MHKTFKRYLSQTFVDFDRDLQGQPTREIWHCVIEYTDGTTRTVIERYPLVRLQNTLTLSPHSYIPNRAARRAEKHEDK